MNPAGELLRHELRRQARAARRALDEHQRREAAVAVSAALLQAFPQPRRIGAYAAVASELDLGPTLARWIAAGVEVYLPHIEHTAPHMQFARWRGQQRFLVPNRFGIPEPLVSVDDLIGAESLDLVLLPLIAYDRHGQRLGSGAGYYDRALAFRLRQPAPPLLLGVGYACQQVERIPAAAWDVPLDGMVTETELLCFKEF
ncbi:MAG: 5-formyltetrahydrofolate cyclo-ligase [Lysobacterales bacterium]